MVALTCDGIGVSSRTIWRGGTNVQDSRGGAHEEGDVERTGTIRLGMAHLVWMVGPTPALGYRTQQAIENVGGLMGILEDLDDIDRILKEADMEDITLEAVSSSQIAAVGFGKEKPEDTRGTLRVQFTSGKQWDYFSVPESVYTSLISAESIGRYFNQNVRKQYGGQEVF